MVRSSYSSSGTAFIAEFGFATIECTVAGKQVNYTSIKYLGQHCIAGTTADH
jgi:hypothetical protein